VPLDIGLSPGQGFPRAGVELFENADDLGFREAALAHDVDLLTAPLGRKSTIILGLLFGAQTPLIRVEDFRFAEARERLFDRIHAKVGGQGVRKSLGQDPTRAPIQHREQVQEPVMHRDIGEVGAPDDVTPL